MRWVEALYRLPKTELMDLVEVPEVVPPVPAHLIAKTDQQGQRQPDHPPSHQRGVPRGADLEQRPPAGSKNINQ